MLLAPQHPPLSRGLVRHTGTPTVCSAVRLGRGQDTTASYQLLLTASCPSAFGRRRIRSSQRADRVVTHMGIRAVETYDSAFQLEPEAEAKLKELLATPTFCAQVSQTGEGGGQCKGLPPYLGPSSRAAAVGRVLLCALAARLVPLPLVLFG